MHSQLIKTIVVLVLIDKSSSAAIQCEQIMTRKNTNSQNKLHACNEILSFTTIHIHTVFMDE